MKTYFIETYRKEESAKVTACLALYGIVPKVEKAITHFETIRFICDKQSWKSIKKDLKLEVTAVFANLRV